MNSARSRHYLFISLGWFFLFMAILGAVLPLLPATPFVLLSLYFFNRSSPRMAQWILSHPWLGPPVLRWQKSRSVSWRIKIWAITVMSSSMLLSVWMLSFQMWAMVLLGSLWVILGVVLLRLPTQECARG